MLASPWDAQSREGDHYIVVGHVRFGPASHVLSLPSQPHLSIPMQRPLPEFRLPQCRSSVVQIRDWLWDRADPLRSPRFARWPGLHQQPKPFV